MKKCLGCGAVLQTDDISKKGYVKLITQNYCQRCFRLTHYNDLTIDMKNAIARKDVLDAIKDIDGLFVLVVDIMAIEAALSRDIINVLKGRDVLLVINKYDTLPANVNMKKIEIYLEEVVTNKMKGINIIDVLLTQKFDPSFREFFVETIKRLDYEKIVFIGNVNAGKSTIVNKLLEDNRLTVSRYPSTTLDFNQMEIEGYIMIDTPGLVDDYSVIMYVNQEELKKVLITDTLKPTIFQLYEPQSYFVEGILRLDLYPAKKNASVIFYINNLLNIHRTKVSNADNYFEKHKDELSICMTEPMTKEIVLDENCEIVINGLGIVSLKGIEKVVLTTQNKIDISIRKTVF